MASYNAASCNLRRTLLLLYLDVAVGIAELLFEVEEVVVLDSPSNLALVLKIESSESEFDSLSFSCAC